MVLQQSLICPFLYGVFYFFSVLNLFLIFSQLGMQRPGSLSWQWMFVTVHLSMHILCLLKQLQHRHMCK